MKGREYEGKKGWRHEGTKEQRNKDTNNQTNEGTRVRRQKRLTKRRHKGTKKWTHEQPNKRRDEGTKARKADDTKARSDEGTIGWKQERTKGTASGKECMCQQSHKARVKKRKSKRMEKQTNDHIKRVLAFTITPTWQRSHLGPITYRLHKHFPSFGLHTPKVPRGLQPQAER